MKSLSLSITGHNLNPHIHHKRRRILCSANKPQTSKQHHPRRRDVILSTPLLCCGGGGFGNNDNSKPPPQRNAALDKMFAKAMFEGMVDYEMAISPVKKRQFAQLKQDPSIKQVVELGAGTGPNLPHYGKYVEKLIAVDANEYMKPYFQRNMNTFMWTPDRVKWIEASADDVPLESGSVDAVVCTLLLCSVPDVKKVIYEAKRLLRPGGKFLFIEHTFAQSNQPLLRAGQFVFNPFQQFFADGCHLTRNPLPIIQSAGFSEVDAEEFTVEGMNLISPHVAGIATL